MMMVCVQPGEMEHSEDGDGTTYGEGEVGGICLVERNDPRRVGLLGGSLGVGSSHDEKRCGVVG